MNMIEEDQARRLTYKFKTILLSLCQTMKRKQNLYW